MSRSETQLHSFGTASLARWNVPLEQGLLERLLFCPTGDLPAASHKQMVSDRKLKRQPMAIKPDAFVSEYKFSAAERYAVFTVHRERCWLCEEMVSLSEMQIDHIIPEELCDKPALAEISTTYGLSSDFNVNSFNNWMPSHGRCNRRKGNHVFRATPIIQHALDKAQEKAGRAEELKERYVRDRKLDRALNDVFIAHENGTLTEAQRDRISQLFSDFHIPNREPDVRDEPVFIAPWLQVIRNDGHFLTVRGPNGMTGVRPVGKNLHPSWDCPRCGITGWSGARCITCGMFDAGD